jgi:hypothetical protein
MQGLRKLARALAIVIGSHIRQLESDRSRIRDLLDPVLVRAYRDVV